MHKRLLHPSLLLNCPALRPRQPAVRIGRCTWPCLDDELIAMVGDAIELAKEMHSSQTVHSLELNPTSTFGEETSIGRSIVNIAG